MTIRVTLSNGGTSHAVIATNCIPCIHRLRGLWAVTFERVQSWRSAWSDRQGTGRSRSLTLLVRLSCGVTCRMRETISTLPLAPVISDGAYSAAYSECASFALAAVSSMRENRPLNPTAWPGSVSHSETLKRRLERFSYLRKSIVFGPYQVCVSTVILHGVSKSLRASLVRPLTCGSGTTSTVASGPR